MAITLHLQYFVVVTLIPLPLPPLHSHHYLESFTLSTKQHSRPKYISDFRIHASQFPTNRPSSIATFSLSSSSPWRRIQCPWTERSLQLLQHILTVQHIDPYGVVAPSQKTTVQTCKLTGTKMWCNAADHDGGCAAFYRLNIPVAAASFCILCTSV